MRAPYRRGADGADRGWSVMAHRMSEPIGRNDQRFDKPGRSGVLLVKAQVSRYA